jgi:hypothetical protein
MARERQPSQPLSLTFRPHGGQPYQVKDGDTWKSIAFHWFLNVEDLIWFNFQTLNPDEVNWYLRRNVGCTKQTPDCFNYVFSSADKRSAKAVHPGTIFIPPRKPIVFRDTFEEFNESLGSRTDLGKALRDADNTSALYDYIGFSLNISDFALTALGISGVELGALGLGLDFFGAATGVVGLGLTLGGPHLGAFDSIKNDKTMSGLSRGIVLGAAGESASFIRDNFVVGSEDHNAQYPEQRKNFQKAYLLGLLKGLEYGRKLTKGERILFFQHVDGLVGSRPPGDFYMNRRHKSERARRDYYIDVAGKFRAESTK